jgi:hypothetical protein
MFDRERLGSDPLQFRMFDSPRKNTTPSVRVRTSYMYTVGDSYIYCAGTRRNSLGMSLTIKHYADIVRLTELTASWSVGNSYTLHQGPEFNPDEDSGCSTVVEPQRHR